jgi:serine protease Do
MSFFAKAACLALKDIPAVNARIEGDEIVYHPYVDLSVAVSAPNGLVVPVVRNVDALSFADIVDRVKPAVVSVSVTAGGEGKVASARGGKGGKGGKGFEGMPDLPDDHPLNEFFKNLPKEFRQQQGPQKPVLGQGSGFLISEDGYVVTNNHVVENATKVQVSFDEHNKHDADVVGTDPRTDLALLKIRNAQNKKFQFVKFASSPGRVGDWVVAVGNPFGLGGTVTAGIVSARGRDIGSGPYDFVQIDAAVNRGNSGGPTFNLDGEVMGVNTAIYSPSGGSVGIAFAIPARTATEVINQLKNSGSVSRGWLGVKIQNVDEDTKDSLGLAEARGALVTEVTANGPAAGAGLKAQDVIMQVNGDKIGDSRELARKIAEFAPATNVDVKVWRNSKEETVKVKLGTFPGSKEEISKLEKGDAPAPSKTSTTDIGDLGLSLAPGKVKEGVAIAEVEQGTDASEKGLKSGDVILEISGQPVMGSDDVISGLKKAKEMGRKTVMLKVKSGDQNRFVPVRLKAKG